MSFENISIHVAAKNGNLNAVKYLNEKNVNLDKCDENGHRPLHIAVKNGHLDIVKYLFENKNKDNQNADSIDALELALKIGHFEIVKYFIDGGIISIISSEQILSIMKYAVEFSKFDIIKYLYEKAETVKLDEKWNLYALAAGKDYLEVMKHIEEVKANLFEEFEIKKAIELATSKRKWKVIKYLIETNLHKENQILIVNTACCTAINEGYLDVIQYLEKLGVDMRSVRGLDGSTVLHLAIRFDKYDIFKYFVDKQFNLEVQDHYGETPLHFALYSNRFDIVQCLVEKKVNLEIKNDLGETVLLKAILRQDNRRIVEYLIHNNANIMATTNDGSTIVHLAAKTGCLDTLVLLTQMSVPIDFEIRDNNGNTPLHSAAEAFNGRDMVDFFYKRGVNLETPNYFGSTPLHIAIQSYYYDAASYLINKNVNLESRDNDGKTPIHYVKVIELLHLLHGKRVNLNAKDNNGNTPLHNAILNSEIQIVIGLIEIGADLYEPNGYGDVPFDLVFETSENDLIQFMHKNKWKRRSHTIADINKSKLNQLVESSIDNEILCKFKYISGPHVLKFPIKLDCSHAMCLKCVFESIGQIFPEDNSCCMESLRNIKIEKILENNRYEPQEKSLSTNMKQFCESLNSTLRLTNNYIIENTKSFESYEKQFTFAEEDIEIRLRSIESDFNSLKIKLLKKVDEIQLKWRNVLDKGSSYENINCYENLFYLRKFKRPRKRALRKDFGWVGLLPLRHFSGYRLNEYKFRLQRSHVLLNMYYKLKSKFEQNENINM